MSNPAGREWLHHCDEEQRMFVISCNDYPYEILPENTSNDQARRRCKYLNETSKEELYFNYIDVKVNYKF